MKITIDVTEEQANRLREVAERLEVTPEQLARSAFADLLTQPAEDFRQAAEYVLRKNRELYQRLS